MNVLKPENPIFLRSIRAADHKIDILRVVTWIQVRVTSGLTHLVCFTSESLSSKPMQHPPYIIWYGLLSYIYRGETSDMSQA